MLLLLITILVILQRSCQGSEFVLLETEAEGDTGNMEDSEPASSSDGDGGDYQDVPNQDKFGCQDCNLAMTPVYGHTPCTGCEEGNPQGSPFSCRACVPGELPKFQCDDCQRNENGRIEFVSVKKFTEFDSRFDRYYTVVPVPLTPRPDAEICEAVGMRSVCNLVDTNTDIGRSISSYISHKKLCQTLNHEAICVNHSTDKPNLRSGIYRLDAGNLILKTSTLQHL